MLAPALLNLVIACGDAPPTRDVRVTIVDEDDRPIPEAVFYAEARDAEGPYAYLVAIAGDAGEVPDTAREPAKILWRKGARITLAAFAEGYRPAVRYREDRPVRTDGAALTLERMKGPADLWRPELVHLHWPPSEPAGAPPDDRAAARLTEHLRAAWEAREALSEPLSPAEELRRRAIAGALGSN
jgi:hypothetical protein